MASGAAVVVLNAGGRTIHPAVVVYVGGVVPPVAEFRTHCP